jgi:hypothetical protein
MNTDIKHVISLLIQTSQWEEDSSKYKQEKKNFSLPIDTFVQLGQWDESNVNMISVLFLPIDTIVQLG